MTICGYCHQNMHVHLCPEAAEKLRAERDAANLQLGETKGWLENEKARANHIIKDFEDVAKELAAANRLNSEWISFAGTLVQKIHDLQHTGSSPLCQQPTCKAFYEKTTAGKQVDETCPHAAKGAVCCDCREKRRSEKRVEEPRKHWDAFDCSAVGPCWCGESHKT